MSHNIINQDGSYALLASVSGIDLKTAAQTTLYTVPTGKTCLITEVVLFATAATAVTSAPIIRIGKTAGFNEWLGLTTLTGLDTTNEFLSLSKSANLLIHQSFAAAEVIKIDVGTVATATTLTVKAFVFGFLV